MKWNVPILQAIAIISCFVLLSSCMKTNNSGGNNSGASDTTNIPYITPLGDNAGAAVSGSIGAAGGTLTSSDGRVQLVVPAGALSQTTNITIQPIVNLCPGGIGLAYDLLPNGTQFAVPASLIFKYTSDEVNGTDPFLVTSAFQDSVGAWEVNDTEKDVDTINNKISFDINHFTPYNFVPEIIVVPDPLVVMENQTSLVKVQVWVVPKRGTYKGGKYVLSKSDVSKSVVSNWQLHNYQAAGADGTLVGNGNTAVYQAPANIDKDKFVEVTCDINESVTVNLKGGKTRVYTALHEGNVIELNAGIFSFDVSISCILHHTSFYIADVYEDGASMQVDVKYNDVTVSKFENQPPTVDPSTGQFGDATVSFVPDTYGIMNIESATGTIKDGNITITPKESGTMYPLWNIQDNHDAGHSTQGGYPATALPKTFVFKASDKTQTQAVDLSNGIDFVVISVYPIH
jgi:hypothetical protein